MGLTIAILTFVVGLAVFTRSAHWFVHGVVWLANVLRVGQVRCPLRRRFAANPILRDES